MAQITLYIDGKECSVEQGLTLQAIVGDPHMEEDNAVMGCMLNGTMRELWHVPKAGDTVATLRISDTDGNRIYQRGLLHMLVAATRECLPGRELDVQHTVGTGIYCELRDAYLSPFELEAIERKMEEYVQENEPFVRKIISREEAVALYRREGQMDKARLLQFRTKDDFKVYACEGISDYFYGYMPPSTGYIRRFRLVYQHPGFVLLSPQASDPSAPLSFKPLPKLAHVFRQSEHWAEILECGTVADLDEMVEQGRLAEFIRVNEALHESNIAAIAQDIIAKRCRVVLVAGPSSSGKTTFTQRLGVQIKVREKRPVMISLDNYYIDRDKIPKDENGKVDLEAITTLDLPLLNEHLLQLLEGQEVQIPQFNFKKGKREPGKVLRLRENEILLLEGIHGLNDELTQAILDEDKYKIYISALTQLNLDRHNRIPTTDVRLLRRMVRDYKHRGSSVEKTLDMWPSVRRGEDTWIFPFQESCDAMFNSTLVYELLYLKQLAYPLLQAVPRESPYFAETNRLVKFLQYFVDPGADQSDIPKTSILREFIGGGCFEQ